MPADDVSDLGDVFDAINKLCDTMKTADITRTKNTDDAPQREDARNEPIVRSVEILSVDDWNALSTAEVDEDSCDAKEYTDPTSTFVSAEDISQRVETPRRESVVSLASSEASAPNAQDRWSDTQTSPPSAEFAKEASQWSEGPVSPPGRDESSAAATDTDPAQAHSEPSEIYYTASSEVSLQSDSEPDKRDDKEDKECVMAGHVAAMRERFESMTRANTPCPDAALDLCRNITPSPDHLA